MTKNTTFKILRDIFHILSYASENDLRAASEEKTIGPNIARSLESLALEASITKQSKAVRKGKAEKKQIPVKSSENNVRKILESSDLLRNKADVLALAREVGIKLQTNPKESHSRVLARFITAVNALPSDTRKEVAGRIQGSKLSEIEGWINVINQPKS